MRIIKGKVKGKKVHLETGAEQRPANVINLMERLRRSLEERGVRSGKSERSRAATTAGKKSSAGKQATRKRSKRVA